MSRLSQEDIEQIHKSGNYLITIYESIVDEYMQNPFLNYRLVNGEVLDSNGVNIAVESYVHDVNVKLNFPNIKRLKYCVYISGLCKIINNYIYYDDPIISVVYYKKYRISKQFEGLIVVPKYKERLTIGTDDVFKITSHKSFKDIIPKL